MVGGIIAGVTHNPPGTFRLLVEGTGCERNETRIVVVKMEDCRLMASIGDHIWWQGNRAFWTRPSSLAREAHTSKQTPPRKRTIGERSWRKSASNIALGWTKAPGGCATGSPCRVGVLNGNRRKVTTLAAGFCSRPSPTG